MFIILATQEAEIRRAVGVAQSEGPEFKHHYCQNKQTNKNYMHK
jgi:hypothetical protein